MRKYTLRGSLAGNTKKILILDDGRFNHGMIVKEFYVWCPRAGDDCEMALCLRADNTGSTWDAANSNQIGWAAQIGTGTTQMEQFSLIDPDHIIVQDLVLNNFGAGDGNYLVILEPKTLTDDQAIMALIKERGQDDL